MGKLNNQNVRTRPLTKDDPKHGNQFREGQEMVIATYDDGREEVVQKNQITN